MDKYIGFDVDSKKTVVCVVQKGQKDKFTTLKTDIELKAVWCAVLVMSTNRSVGGSQPEIQIPPYFLPLTPSVSGEGAKGHRGRKYFVNKASKIKKVQIKQKNSLTGSGS